jgi:D-alanyl-D-alanine carboxypeptidase/D-alanyl-D-alanine-endopeptidase (penicillin-binding protein 4)
MQARARRFSPGTDIARMAIVDRPTPVYEYSQGSGADRWTVARGALGRAEGARWLPVRFPALYTADVFRTLARTNGIVLKAPELVPEMPDGQVIVRTESEALADVVREMLKYSTNLTAEAAGMMASLSNGVPVDGLLASGSRMAGWAQSRYGVRNLLFRDHSGLGYGSEIGAEDMVRILSMNPGAAEFLKTVVVPDPKSGAKAQPLKGVQAVAKTGTLNFVSSLVGYLRTNSGRDLVFAILTADTARRDAIPPELREGPPGSRSWAQRSRNLQKSLLSHWAVTLDGV